MASPLFDNAQIPLSHHPLITLTLYGVPYNTVQRDVQPTTCSEGRERECSYNFTLSLTSAADGGRCFRPRRRLFIPGKEPVPTAYENGEENLAHIGIRIPDIPASSQSL